MRMTRHGRRATTAAAVLTLALAWTSTQATAAPPAAEAPSATAVRQYEVAGVATAAERTELARTGTAIDEIRAGSVLITADAAHAARLAGLGYELTALTAPEERGGPRAAAPSDYHTYDDVIAALP